MTPVERVLVWPDAAPLERVLFSLELKIFIIEKENGKLSCNEKIRRTDNLSGRVRSGYCLSERIRFLVDSGQIKIIKLDSRLTSDHINLKSDFRLTWPAPSLFAHKSDVPFFFSLSFFYLWFSIDPIAFSLRLCKWLYQTVFSTDFFMLNRTCSLHSGLTKSPIDNLLLN